MNNIYLYTHSYLHILSEDREQKQYEYVVNSDGSIIGRYKLDDDRTLLCKFSDKVESRIKSANR